MIDVYRAAAQMTYDGAFTESMHGDNLAALKVNGSPVAFTRQTIKGVNYALFQVAPGAYQGTYTP